MAYLNANSETVPYRALCTGLPPSPGTRANQPKSLLLVLVADFNNMLKEKLMQHLRPSNSDFEIQTWHPSHDVLQSLAPQRQHRDSQANLYGLAIVAYRKGHSCLVVADELTKRQVNGDLPLRGEDERISVVMIAVRQGNQSGQVRVIAKRSAMENDENIALLAAVQAFEISGEFEDVETREGVPMIYSDSGFELHDPDCPVFTPSTTNRFGYEQISTDIMTAIDMSTPFPPELVLDVTSRAERDIGESTTLPLGLNFKPNQPIINIILGFKTTANEREHLLSVLEDAVRVELKKQKPETREDGDGDQDESETDADADAADPSRSNDTKHPEPAVHLIPWERTRPPSRRDIAGLPQTVAACAGTRKTRRVDKHLELPYFLMESTKKGSVTSAEFISIEQTTMGLGVFRTTLDDMVHYKQGIRSPSDLKIYYESGQMEILPASFIRNGYEEPFYPTSLPWNPIGLRMNAIPLFFLTNKLSDQQVREIYEEIRTMNDIDEDDWGQKVICPVPWKENEPDAEDGTPADMWRIDHEVHDSCEHPRVFVDLQSGEDLKIIMTDRDWFHYESDNEEAHELLKDVESPAYRGLSYGRLPGRDAHITWTNLNIANMSFDEFFDFDEGNTTHRFLRPDWPCHDRVDEYGEWIFEKDIKVHEEGKEQSNEGELE